MRALLFAIAAGSALFGGVAGASVVLWVTGSASPAARVAGPGAPGASAPAAVDSVDGRLAALERGVQELQRRKGGLPVLLGADSAARRALSPAPEAEAALIDDPVFEAAVRDIVEQAAADREAEREVQREDRRKQLALRWLDELGPRLALNDVQKTKLREIAERFMSELGKFWEGDGGATPARAERRAKMQEMRASAEQELRSVLDARQMATYEGLDEEQKLGFARRRAREP